ncbi:MAG: ABC transporter ATP-binding protein [Deltaproteobacteria bacterium]|nr:ABC transporter ATP-binding protein [Deltaproteobacteria bacterium]
MPTSITHDAAILDKVPLVKATSVSKIVRDANKDIAILKKINLEINIGECVALLGPSGSGKSTLLNILGALDNDFSGEVTIANANLHALSDSGLSTLRNKILGFIFQAYNLLGHLSALDNVLLPARFGNETLNYQRAHEVLSHVGLGEKTHRLPRTLSGGECQRVAIARALYLKPKLLLCDEPTGNLDGETAAIILQLFSELSNQGVALLIATHDNEIAAMANRQIHLHKGNLSEAA